MRLSLPHLALIATCALGGASAAHAQDRAPGPRNVRLVFQLVEADGFDESDAEIRDVVSELRELFRFRGYRLAATGLLNSAAEGAEARARLTGGEEGGFTVRTEVWNTGDPNLLRVAVELVHEAAGLAMAATVNVRDGQTLVLGSTRSYEGPEGNALILIMRSTFDY